MKETAVEFLERMRDTFGIVTTNDLKKAKEMEKEQRGYSEEDLEVAYFEGKEGLYSFNEWFEQFKNK